jgi:hypothetical protein
MKQIFTISVFIAFAFTITSFTTKTPTLIGKWQGEDEGQVGIITFEKGGYVSFFVDGEVVGGKKYEVEGIVMDVYYETDDSSTPHTIDFVFKLHEGQIEISRMLGIYHLVNDKTLILNMKFDGQERPKMLDETSKDQIMLKKVSS